MTEVLDPGHRAGGFGDSSIQEEAHRLNAAFDLATISQMRSRAHTEANLLRDFHVGTVERNTDRLRGKLSRAQGALARWALMAEHPEYRTIDLVRIDNQGDWDATAEAEEEIAQLAEELRDAGRGGEVIDKHSKEAKRRITVDPIFLSAEGLLVVRRKRLMLATTAETIKFADRRRKRFPIADLVLRGRMEAETSIEIDKVSEFVLDLETLQRMHPKAAQEVADAAGGRAPSEITNHGRSLVSPRIIEAAIDVQHEVLTPAVTTYYADRKYKNIRRARASDVSVEPAVV